MNMEIVVCVKRVPMTQEVDLRIREDKKDVKRDGLAWVVNDWDNYAVEEAVRIVEASGGTVTAVTVGVEDDEEVLRRALAMGAERAIRVEPGDLVLDPWVTSGLLAGAIRDLNPDLVLTGVQSEDDNHGAVGVMLAQRLKLAHASVVNRIALEGKETTLHVELEGGMDEISTIRLPALVTVQTGINEPRYVSIMGIRKARKKELRVVQTTDLGLQPEDLTPRTRIQEMYLPPEGGGAELIEGDPATLAEAILGILKEKGVNV
jgi:electron transfer flavoprotein beta subunit